MKKFLLCITVVVGLAVLGNFGAWSIRANVARDKFVERIDAVLGKMDVKRKEIEVSVASLEQALLEIRKAKIKAQVKQDQLARKTKVVDSSIRKYDQSLQRLRTQLASGINTNIDGRIFTSSELSRFTQQVIDQREIAVNQRNAFQVAVDRLGNVVSILEQKQSEYQGKLGEIENQLSVIDSNRVAMKAMQEAATVMDGSDVSFSQNVEKLENKVNDLYADLEAGLIAEDIRWQNDDFNSVDQFVNASQSPTDLVKQIDFILSDSQLAESSK